MYLVIFAAIAPVVVLLWQILKRDSANPEPPKMLMKAFFYGMVSTVVTFIFLPVTEVIGDMTMSTTTLSHRLSSRLSSRRHCRRREPNC